MGRRVYNFNPGPAVLPVSVIEEASKSVLEYGATGMSILEMSHRGKEIDGIFIQAEKDILEIMGLGDGWQVLFLGGGASMQFAMVPMNFLPADGVADYVNTGTWAKGAIKEAKLLGNVNVVGSSEDKSFSCIPKACAWTDGAAYAHVTTNNTIEGTQYHFIPDVKAPLVADMSSDLLSWQMDFSKFSLIYGGAQKNMGPAGVTLVILRKEMLEKIPAKVPIMLNYKTHADKLSMHNTPPVFPTYVVGLVAKWIKAQGGLKAVEELNRKKAELLYASIDERPEFYLAPVAKEDRSWMNVVFRLPSEELENKFLAEAKTKELLGLKGHRSVGGIRASIYNAFPYEGVEVLVEFMRSFAKKEAGLKV